MTIIDKTEKQILFQTIPVGYTFCHDDKVFMTIDSRCTAGKNAVCLSNGHLFTFHRDAEVTPCVTVLEVTKKGTFA